jgi:hypothetical protein
VIWTLQEQLLRNSEIAFVVLCITVFILMGRKRLLVEYPTLAALLCVQAIDALIAVTILFFRKPLGLTLDTAYSIYFYSHWICFTCEEILQVFVIYSVFSLAMRPLQGLHSIGKIIFRWVAAVSIAVSLGIAAGPHFVSSGYSATMLYTRIASQSEQGIGVLTLCLLLFVCFSTKPLGLTYGSRTFGVSLGLGVMAMTTLVEAAWASIEVGRSLYSPVYLFGMLGLCSAVLVWGIYFALPEPERKLILLPTTSPFFFWNRISEALGDAPGHVAIAGFRPDMLAAAEMQMFSAPPVTRIGQPVEDFNMSAIPPQLLHATASR